MAFDFPSSPTVDQVYTDFGVSYIWNGYGWMMIKSGGSTGPGTPGDYVLKTGDVMSGPLSLPGDPTAPLHSATKAYVDSKSALPLGGAPGEALTKNASNTTVWGAPIDPGSNF